MCVCLACMRVCGACVRACMCRYVRARACKRAACMYVYMHVCMNVYSSWRDGMHCNF